MPDQIISKNGYPTKLSDNKDGTYSEVSGSKDVTGQGSVRYTSDTNPVTGDFAQIMCLTNTAFSSFTRPGATGSITGIALPAGTLLIGPVTAYTLASGAVAAYS